MLNELPLLSKQGIVHLTDKSIFTLAGFYIDTYL